MGKKSEDSQISIIVPVYNVIDYLPQCLDSLLCQTHSNIEIIIIDDGSSDGCSELIDEYARHDQRIKSFHTKNSGLSAARNRGLDASSGDYLMFVDSDDYVERDFCKEALSLVVGNQVEVAAFGYNGFWADDNNYVCHSTKQPRLLNKEDAIRELIERKDVFYNMVWNKIFSHHLFNGIRFPEGRTFEDMAVMHIVLDRVLTGIYISDKVLYNYRQDRKNSIMSRATTPTILDDRLTNELARLQFIKDYYPDLNQSQINVLVKVCEQCFIYMPDSQFDYRIAHFMKTNKYEVLAATTGLRKIRFQSYYAMHIVFRLINIMLRRFIYHINE